MCPYTYFNLSVTHHQLENVNYFPKLLSDNHLVNFARSENSLKLNYQCQVVMGSREYASDFTGFELGVGTHLQSSSKFTKTKSIYRYSYVDYPS